jgi:membrane protein involved in colicin uptake
VTAALETDLGDELDDDEEEEEPAPVSTGGFGGRTDGSVGMDLGLAPSGLGSGRSTDPNAPMGLADNTAGAAAPRTVRPEEKKPPEEHPHAREMRLAAESLAKQRAKEAAEKAERIRRRNERTRTAIEAQALEAKAKIEADAKAEAERLAQIQG